MRTMLDEEALANQQHTTAPQPTQAEPELPVGDDPEQAAERGAQASPQEQKMFEQVAKQAIQMLTSEQGAEALLAAAKSKGAEPALAEMLAQTLQGIAHAARSAGVPVSGEILLAAAEPPAKLMLGMLAEAGLAEPDTDVTQVMGMLGSMLEG